MNETIEGTLHVSRVFRSRGMTIGALIADYVQPRYYKQPSAYVTAGELVGKRHEVVVGLRGKVLDTLTPEDDGKPVKVTGIVTWNTNGGPNYKYRLGTMRRASVEFAASTVTSVAEGVNGRRGDESTDDAPDQPSSVTSTPPATDYPGADDTFYQELAKELGGAWAPSDTRGFYVTRDGSRLLIEALRGRITEELKAVFSLAFEQGQRATPSAGVEVERCHCGHLNASCCLPSKEREN